MPSVDNEIALWSGTSGTVLKRATGTGIVKVSSGVLSATATITQAESHGTPDTDSATSALHHTLGTGANQAAAGNHAHSGMGDVTGQASSVDSELALFSGAGGKTIKRSTGSGAVRLASGVMSLGDAAQMPWISGSYYDSSVSIPDSAWTAGSATALRLYANPIYVPNDVTISEVGINVTTGAASALARVGLYSLGSDNKPGALFWQGASTLDVSSTGEKILSSLSLAVPGGRWYYTAMVIDLTGVSTHTNASPNTAPLGYTAHSATLKISQYFKTLGSLVLPDPFGTPTGSVAALARVSLKVA